MILVKRLKEQARLAKFDHSMHFDSDRMSAGVFGTGSSRNGNYHGTPTSAISGSIPCIKEIIMQRGGGHHNVGIISKAAGVEYTCQESVHPEAPHNLTLHPSSQGKPAGDRRTQDQRSFNCCKNKRTPVVKLALYHLALIPWQTNRSN